MIRPLSLVKFNVREVLFIPLVAHVCAAAFAADPPPTTGTVDPVPSSTLFPDQELGIVYYQLPIPGGSNTTTYSAMTLAPPTSTSTPLQLNATPSNVKTNISGWDSPFSQRSLGAGRIVDPSYDQLVALVRTDTGNTRQFTLCGISTQTGHNGPAIPAVSFPSPRFVGVVDVGDVDGVPTTQGTFPEEIACVTMGSDNLELRVYTYASGQPVLIGAVIPLSRQYQLSLYIQGASVGINGVFDVGMADVDGDGLMEVAVAYPCVSGSNTYLAIDLYKYDASKSSMVLLAQPMLNVGQHLNPVMIATGDFDGDTREEVALLYTGNYDGTHGSLLLGIVGWNTSAYDFVMSGQSVISGSGSDAHFDTWLLDDGVPKTVIDASIASGLFRIDPPHGFYTNRRQLVVASSNVHVNQRIYATIIELASPNSPAVGSTPPSSWTAQNHIVLTKDSSYYLQYCYSGHTNSPGWVPISVVTANTTGPAGNSLADQVVISYNDPGNKDSLLQWYMRLFTVNYGNGSYSFANATSSFTLAAPNNQTQGKDCVGCTYSAGLVIPYDADGDSLVLGPPTKFTLTDNISVQYVLQQPPQHLDYLPNSPYADQDTGVVNVSRYSGFNVNYVQSNGNSTVRGTTNTMSGNVGLNLEGSLKIALSEKIPFVEKAKVAVTIQGALDLAIKGGHTWSNQNTASQNRNLEMTTITDDGLSIQNTTEYIWMYPLYGAQALDESGQPILQPDGQPAVTTFQLYFPGNDPNYVLTGGHDVPQYQPTHENGNLLSYPVVDSGNYAGSSFYTKQGPNGTSGYGTWTYQESNASEPTAVTGALSVPTQFTFGGTEPTLTLQMQQAEQAKGQSQIDATLKANVDFKFNEVVQAKEDELIVLLGKEKERGHVSVGLTGGFAFSQGSSKTTNTSNLQSLSLNTVASKNPNWDYYYYPLLSYDTSGTLMMTFAAGTENKAGNANWWSVTYREPDPAVSLPFKFIQNPGNGNAWQLNLSPGSMKMRGFFVLENEKDPFSNTHLPLAYDPIAGESVRLQTRLANYSVGSDMDSIQVRFDAVEVSASGSETGQRFVLQGLNGVANPVTAVLGDANGATVYADGKTPVPGPGTTTKIPPRGIGLAEFPISTAELAPTGSNSSRYWRIYVVLNPDGTNPQDETHGWRWPKARVMIGATPEVGDTYAFNVYLNKSNQPYETISYTVATGMTSEEHALEGLQDAFNNSNTAKTYELSAVYTEQNMTIGYVGKNGTATPPPSTDFVPGIVVPANGTAESPTTVSFVPSQPANENVNAVALYITNLEPGQNNSGYYDMTVNAKPNE